MEKQLHITKMEKVVKIANIGRITLIPYLFYFIKEQKRFGKGKGGYYEEKSCSGFIDGSNDFVNACRMFRMKRRRGDIF